VEKLEGLLQEREELGDITLRWELEALSTHETSLDHREAELEQEQKALEDVRAQVLARELDADARDTGLRDQEAQLVAREWQLVERQMQELVITQKGLEDLRASQDGDGQRVRSFLGQVDATLASFGFSLIQGGNAAPEAGVVLPLLDSAGRKISQREEAVGKPPGGGRLRSSTGGGWPRADVLPEPWPQHLPGAVVQGLVEGSAEAARDGVEDATRAVAERFEREPEDA
jgi:uncharacterized protein (DUF3084 family)